MSGKLQISESLKAASERLALVIGSNPLEAVFKKAEVVIAVRDWLQVPEVMQKVKQLQNTPSGFQTDEKAGYADNDLAVCVTDALCAGFQLVGNEFSIIGGRMMGVLNGYNRLVDTFDSNKDNPDTGLKMIYKEVVEGDITVNGNMVRVPMTIKYTLLDKATKVKSLHEFSRTIQLAKRYDKEGPDAWIGKATRRILKKLLVNLSGSDLGDDLGDESSATGGAAGQAPSMPPTGTVDLGSKPKGPAPAKADDAMFTEVVDGAKKDPNWTPVADALAPTPEPPPTAPAEGPKKGKKQEPAPPAPDPDVF